MAENEEEDSKRKIGEKERKQEWNEERYFFLLGLFSRVSRSVARYCMGGSSGNNNNNSSNTLQLLLLLFLREF